MPLPDEQLTAMAAALVGRAEHPDAAPTPSPAVQEELRHVDDSCRIDVVSGDIRAPYGDGSASHQFQYRCPEHSLRLRIGYDASTERVTILGYTARL